MKMERETFINAMRCVASSVTVVTTNGSAGRYGATVSAFCSVSADPPTVLVCLNSKSRIAKGVIENKKFNINVLSQNANKIAQRFAGVNDSELLDRFEGIDLQKAEIPAINGATVFSCEVDQVIPSGTHQVVIGKVDFVETVREQPLTYFDGSYHQVTPLTLEVV